MKSMTMWLILLLATYVECDLVVYLPSCAVSKFNGPILYTQSNFGYVPYGETLIGSVYVPVKE